MRTPAPVVVLLGALLAACCSAKPLVVARFAQTVTKHIEADTTADPYALLKPEERRKWAKDNGKTINETIKHFIDIPVQPTIDVRLIGFDGHGFQGIQFTPNHLMNYLQALRAETVSVALQPILSELVVYPEFQYKVTHDTSGMLPVLTNAVKTQAAHIRAASATPAHGMPIHINYKTVDNIVAADSTRRSSAILTIYLLNLDAQAGRYVYNYTVGDEDTPGYCAGTHYIGTANASPTRYLWLDVTAGPISYGPGPRQKGHVFDLAMPHPKHYKDAHVEEALMPTIAATIWSATKHLVWPPLQHPFVDFKPKVLLQVIHIHETMTHGAETFQRDRVSEALRQALGGRQHVEVQETWVSMSGCALCVEAYTMALQTQAARDQTSTVLMTQDQSVLDPLVLYSSLRRHQEGIFGHAGIAIDAEPNQRIVPVFIFDVKSRNNHPVLFQGGELSAAFPDMILAVASRSGHYRTPAVCGYHQVVADSSDVTRAVLSGLMITGFGLSNLSASYVPSTGVDLSYLWTITNTPFGDLSASTDISGPLADLIPRNMVLTTLNRTTSRMVTLLQGFARLSKDGDFDSRSCGEYKERVLARVNLAGFKVRMAAHFISEANYWQALLYAKSMKHDISALERVVVKIAKNVGTSLQCHAGGPTLASVWWAPCIALGMWPVAKFLRGRLYRKKFDKIY